MVRTKQPSSRDAVVNVARQDFEYYRPLYRERPSIGGVRTPKPLFPYYLLVRISLRDDKWKVLASTKGVTHLFMSGDEPSRVRDEDVERIRHCENELGYYVDPAQEPPRFDVGEPIRAVRGFFNEQDGVYQGLAGSTASRIKVLFSFLGKPMELEVSAYDFVSNACIEVSPAA